MRERERKSQAASGPTDYHSYTHVCATATHTNVVEIVVGKHTLCRGKGKRKINKIFDHMYHNCVKFIDTLLALSQSDYKHTLRHHHLPTEEQRVRRSEVRPTKQRKTFILDNIVQHCARREKNTRRESPSITLCERRNN